MPKQLPSPKPKPPKKNKGGRPRKHIDWEQFGELCRIQCTQDEIAAVMGISVDTLDKRSKEAFDLSLSELYDQKRQGGKMSLRRAQYNAAMDSSSKAHGTMLVWLGKNWLGQSDGVKVDHNISQETFDQVYRIKFGEDDESS